MMIGCESHTFDNCGKVVDAQVVDQYLADFVGLVGHNHKMREYLKVEVDLAPSTYCQRGDGRGGSCFRQCVGHLEQKMVAQEASVLGRQVPGRQRRLHSAIEAHNLSIIESSRKTRKE
ncbi:unnamed protein product [Phaeothamnion confervicola]